MPKPPAWPRIALVAGALTGLAVVIALVAVALVRRSSAEEAAEEEGEDAAAPVAADDTDAGADDDASAAELTSGSSPRTFNVILVTIDTLRWDLGYMGYPRPITPNLDKLAARSAVFERAYATASYTPKCMGPMMIGRYASETHRDGEHYTTFYGANVLLAERLKEAGHRTVGAMCHHYFKWKTGLDQGFDVWDTSAVPASMADNDPSVTSADLTDVALGLLGQDENVTLADDHRFFAWFHYMDPHLPYVPHEGAPDLVAAAPDAAPPERSLYDQEVWYTDQQVGRLLDFVESQPWGPETAIIVTADHGEAFGEHGFMRHGRELWEPIVRVPLIVYVPGVTPRRLTIKRSHIDLVPTVLELVGVPVADDAKLRGKSLLADLAAKPGAALEERDVYMDMPEGPFNEARRAIITGDGPGLKLIDFGGRYELYDLREDPLETKNIRGDGQRLKLALDRMQALRSQLEETPTPPWKQQPQSQPDAAAK